MIGGNSFSVDTLIFQCKQCNHSRVNLDVLSSNDSAIAIISWNHKQSKTLSECQGGSFFDLISVHYNCPVFKIKICDLSSTKTQSQLHAFVSARFLMQLSCLIYSLIENKKIDLLNSIYL